jgi:S-DNA-T family DNA segregation ATPase FtsK/SpoIIIE
VINGDSDMTIAAVARSLFITLSDDSRSSAGDLRQNIPISHSQDVTGGAHLGLWVDGRMLDPSAPAARELRDGAVVTVDPRRAAATVRAEPTGLVEIRVAGGPVAGAVHRLGIGTTVLGSAPDTDVRVADPHIPPRALEITVEGTRTVVAPLAGTAAALDHVPLEVGAEWPIGGMLIVGATVLTLAPSEPRGAHLSPLDDGGLAYSRPPRTTPFHRPRRIEVPRPPERNPRDRLHGHKSYRKAVKEYRAQREQFGRAVERLRQEDEAERRTVAPDPAEVLLTATGPRRRLWERRRTDPDVLRLRAGVADLPADLELIGAVPGRSAVETPISRTVPVTLPLAELGVVGLAGPRDRSRRLAGWLVAQAAALHSPRDLAVVVLSASPTTPSSGDTDGAAHWNWVRWLPHCAPRAGEDCVALVGTDPDSVARRATELTARIADRQQESVTSSFFGDLAAIEPAANVLVVLDGARLLRRVAGMPQVLSRGPEFGVYAICIDDDERLLPAECAAVVGWDRDRPEHVRVRGSSTIPGLDDVGAVLVDQVGPAWCDRLARALAPVRDVARDSSAESTPASARLLDLLGMPNPTAEQVLAFWSRGGRTTRVPVGVAADGVFSVNLRADGPHGLIAGTTGAGKSELLRTLIASLAVANRPDEMTFVLIDYKGGGAAFKDCAELPHTAGLVTDLDGHLTERALASLAAELRRREQLLLAAGAKDIEDYHDRRDRAADRGQAAETMPRLVLVIDEFAALVAELPGFVAGLVDIGRRGRSLGVHLILATRRPAGVVTPDIRANTNLRIALRVTDADESIDILDAPDAARIAKSTPGRCYVRSGAAAPRPVQSARIDGRRPGAATAVEVSVAPLPWGRLGHPPPDPDRATPAGSDDAAAMVTDLAVLVDAVREAAARAHIAAQPAPWPAPLPDKYVLAPRVAAGGSAVDLAPVPFGITDVPGAQAREPLTLDLAGGGHVYLAGSPRSGRSTALRTLAGSLASLYSPYDVHLYAIDCGAGALLPLVSLPHCGAVVGRDQPDRMERLLAALAAEVARRRRLLAAAGFVSLAEQRAAVAVTERLPWMVLLLDSWEGFVAAFESYDYGRLVDAVLRLLREGGAVGLRGVFAGDRSGLQGQVATVFDRRLVMRMADPADYGVAGFGEHSVPSWMPPGRALERVTPGEPLRESQIGLLCAGPADAAQVAALQDIARGCAARHGRPARPRRPLHVDELPVRVTYGEALALDQDFLAPSPLWALVGAGRDELAPVGVDLLADGPGFVVAGPARSGRSTCLLTMVESLLDPRIGTGLVPVVLITPRRSPLSALAGRPGVLGVLDASADSAGLDDVIGVEHRYVVVADDAELLDETGLDDALAGVLRSARDGQHAVVIGGTTEDLGRGHRGFLSDARRSRSGVLLSIRTADDGELLGLQLPRNAPTGGPVGRGLFVATGVATPVQVALPGPPVAPVPAARPAEERNADGQQI